VAREAIFSYFISHFNVIVSDIFLIMAEKRNKQSTCAQALHSTWHNLRSRECHLTCFRRKQHFIMSAM